MTDATIEVPETLDTTNKKQSYFGVPLNKIQTEKAVKSSNALLENGQFIKAQTNVLGKENISLTGALQTRGEDYLTIPFQKSGFTFNELFTDFVSEQLEQFIFDDVDIQITKSGENADKLCIEFAGRLRIDKEPLASVAKALNILEAPLLTGSIITGDNDLRDKITPQSLKLASAPAFEVNVSPGVNISQTAFAVEINQDNTDKWQIKPSAEGSLEITGISATPLTVPCKISYANESLFVNGRTEHANDLFQLPGLNLSFLEVDTVLGKNNAVTINSAFQAGDKSFQLGGSVNELKAGIYTRESNFSLADLNAIVVSLTGETLSLPTYDIELTNILFGFATADGTFGQADLEEGLTFHADISIFGHSTNVKLQINSEGVSLLGALEPQSFGPVNIKEAVLRLDCYNASASKTSSFSIVGATEIEGLELDCKVAYEKVNNNWESIVYAAIKASTFNLSDLFPQTKDSFVDSLAFNNAALIYSSYSGTTQDKDFDFSVKKGLQLVGNMKKVPAISDLTGKDDLNLVLSAYFGNKKEISIALPDTRLDLGKSVTTSPFSIGVELAPKPSLDLVFGMDVKVPKQQDPLHFDLSLSIGVLGASGAGTMKNYWVEPFGVKGLKVGPNLALELGIIYQQFVTTGTPSSFGFVGGIALGDVIAQMAMKISVDPSEQILMGKLEKLTPSNLISFVNDATKAGIPATAVPDFFDIKDLEIYLAPTGGSIGTVEFDQGFSFRGDLVLFDKAISIYARLGDDGIVAQGELDKITLGPLSIHGKRGEDAELDLEITSSSQSILIDGEIDLLGSSIGLYANLSSKGIDFSFEQNFMGLMNYTIAGESSGSLHQPENLDFKLRGEFHNDITAYLKNDLSKRIHAAINVVDSDISKAQADVTKAEKAYKAELSKAQTELTNAKNKADADVEKLRQDLQTEKANYSKNIQTAKAALTQAKKAYDQALNNAQQELTKAEGSYTRALKQAQAEVDKAGRAYNTALTNAQNEVAKARRNYNNAVGSAKRNLTAAINKVNGLQRDIDSANRRLKKNRNPFKAIKLAGEVAALETAKAVASTALKAARSVVSGVTKGAEYAAFESANSALEAVKQGGKYAAFENAKHVLEGVKQGGKYAAFKSAKATLKAVQQGSQYTAWQAANESVKAAEVAGKAAISAAQQALKDISKSAIYIAYEAANANLELVKQGSSFIAFQTANAALEGAKQSAGAALKLAEFAAKHAGDIIDIRSVLLSAHLKGLLGGDFFIAKVDFSVFGRPVKASLDFDVNDVGSFIENLFKQALQEAERLALSAAK